MFVVFLLLLFVVCYIIHKLLIHKISDFITEAKRFKPYYLHNNKQENVKETDYYLDPVADLTLSYNRKFIDFQEREDFKNYYYVLYKKAVCLNKNIKKSFLRLPPKIKIFIKAFEGLDRSFSEHNRKYIEQTLVEYKSFFDKCLKYPLDNQQRRSIVSEEINNLVVSSAGSGKTSSIIGKVMYLTQIRGVRPEKILLISYTNKAAAELTERLNIPCLRGYTFHKLALDMISHAEGRKPSICDNPDKLFVTIYRDLLQDKNFRSSIIKYFLEYQSDEEDWEQKKRERREMLSEKKKTRVKVQFPDMDGNRIYVKSEQEKKICNALTSLNISFRYEEPYQYSVEDEMHSQYKPDFSIYYYEGNSLKRVYLEHYGIDEHGLVPSWFAFDRGMTYEEANSKYNDGITWKKAAHEKFKTKLLCTTSADFKHYDIRERLKQLFTEAAIPFKEKTEEELYNMVLPSRGKQEKAFIRLVITFITLLKSSCKSITDVIRLAKENDDYRSEFIIKEIFNPVYIRYVNALKDNNLIDFTDAIINATVICRDLHPNRYEYIIVDEFQDISVDRYNFLKELRATEPQAKLYCVGDDWQSIYRFSGSDMSLFNQFAEYFGYTEINKIETTYRFGQPLVDLSSGFIQRNKLQLKKEIRPSDNSQKTELLLCAYERKSYCDYILNLINSLSVDKSIFLLGRYSFDDYYLSFKYKLVKEGTKSFYIIGTRKIEFLTVHKAKGLEADYVILLMCNRDTYGFPSLVNDDSVLNYVLTEKEEYPFAEERRLFYVAITRAKIKTFVLYDHRFPSPFVEEFIHPEKKVQEKNNRFSNANKVWSKGEEQLLLTMYNEGKNIKYIAKKLGRSKTAITMRLGKLESSEKWN